MNRSDVEHAFTRESAMFVVLAKATITAKPSKGSFDNPSSREHLKVLKRRVALDNFQDSVQMLMNLSLIHI